MPVWQWGVQCLGYTYTLIRRKSNGKKILITGVYGLIGNVVYRELNQTPDEYDVYGLARRRASSDRIPEDQTVVLPDDHFHLANLTDFDAVQRAVSGMDVVVHMAADPSGSQGFESILQSNLIGAYHIFEACRLEGVKRVIYASSIQVSFGYWDTEPYKTLREADLMLWRNRFLR